MLLSRKILVSLLLLYCIVFHTQAQNTYVLNLDSAISIALKSNYRIRMLREELSESNYRLKAAMNRFKTNASFNFETPKYEEGYRQETDSSGTRLFPVKHNEYSGIFEISQPLITDGRLFMKMEAYNEDNFLNKNRLSKISSGIGFEQPLQAFFIYNKIRSEFKQAKLNYELAQKTYKREELDLIYNISQAFYALIESQQRMTIAQEDYKRQQEANTLAQSKYTSGLIREVEALQIEVDLGEASNQFDISISNFNRDANYMKQELGIRLNDSIVAFNKMEYNVVLVDVEKAIEQALMNRTEISEKEIQIELSKIRIRRQKADGMISGSISAKYDFIGSKEMPITGSYISAFNSSYNNLINLPGKTGIWLTIKIPIFDWGVNRSLVRAENAALNINTINLDYTKVQIEREIMNNVDKLKSSLKRLLLLEKNIKLAERSFEISYYRFSNGDIDAEALALDRARYNRANLQHISAYVEYKMQLLDLKRKTFYDFETKQAINFETGEN